MRKALATLLASACLSFTAWGPFPEPSGPVTPAVPPDQSAELAKARKLSLKRLRGWRHEIHLRIGDRGRYRVAIRRVLQGFGNHPLDRSFLCIHGFEGRWDDPSAPYWGGLQMDKSFMLTYGAEFYRWFGTADHWPAAVQMTVAIKAYMSRGFSPWPNTRVMCGL